MCISTTTLTSSPSGLTAAGQKQEACSSTGSLTRPSPSDRPRTTPSSLTLSLATRPPNWSEADTIFGEYRDREVVHEFVGAARRANFKGTLYIGYPVLAIDDERIEFDAVLVSRDRGVIIFDLY